MVVDKKFFKFAGKLLSKIIDGFYVFPTVCILFDRHNSIVSFFVFLVALFPFNYANRAATEHASGEGGLIHQDQDVYWITVIRLCGRNKSEVIRKGHSRWQHFFKFKYMLVRIERKLVPASFWSFDHNAKHLLVFNIERLE